VICRWFVACLNPATGTTPHPVLGEVPTCDRCHAFATSTPRGARGVAEIVSRPDRGIAAAARAFNRSKRVED